MAVGFLRLTVKANYDRPHLFIKSITSSCSLMTGVTYQTWHHGNAVEIAGCCGVFLGNNLNEKTLCVLSTDVTSLWCVCVCWGWNLLT